METIPLSRTERTFFRCLCRIRLRQSANEQLLGRKEGAPWRWVQELLWLTAWLSILQSYWHSNSARSSIRELPEKHQKSRASHLQDSTHVSSCPSLCRHICLLQLPFSKEVHKQYREWETEPDENLCSVQLSVPYLRSDTWLWGCQLCRKALHILHN